MSAGALGVRRLASAALATGLSLPGCGEEPPGPPNCGSGPASLEVGTGSSVFTPIADGDLVFVKCGSQGGRHIDIQLRALGVAPRFTLRASLTDLVSGNLLGTTAPRSSYRFKAAPDGCVAPDGFFVVIGPASESIRDRQAILDAEITDCAGTNLRDQRQVVLDLSMAPCAR